MSVCVCFWMRKRRRRGSEFCASSFSVGADPTSSSEPPVHPGSSKELPSSPTSSLLCLPLETDSMDCMHDIPAVWVAQPFFFLTASPTAHRAPKAQQPRGASTFTAPSSPSRSSAQLRWRAGGLEGWWAGGEDEPLKSDFKNPRKIYIKRCV